MSTSMFTLVLGYLFRIFTYSFKAPYSLMDCTMNHDLEEISTTDLAELFRRSVNISNSTGHNNLVSSQPDLVGSHGMVQEEPVSINYSISQHYTHSAHIVQAINAEQISANKIMETRPRGLSIYQILAQHNIPPSSLVRSQLTLFEQADEDQRARLIQLWSLSLPQRTRNLCQPLVKRSGEYQPGASEYTEGLAWLHQQRNAFDQSFHRDGEPKYDCGDHRRWSHENDLVDAETYITSGYEQLAQRDYDEQTRRALSANLSTSAGLIFGGQYNHATDPIYQGRGCHDGHSGQQDVGHHQYNFITYPNRQHTQADHVITIEQADDEEML